MPESVRSDNIASGSLSNLTKVFLPILESLRDLLARQLVQDCHVITDKDLNHTILSSILQVLFLRTGQDCGFVEPGTLALLAGSDGISRRMARACSDAGLSPNILFENVSDGPRPIPAVSDDALREVIQCMDSAKFPAPISTMPLEHLAIVFEHFLGTRVQVAEGYPCEAYREVCGALYRKCGCPFAGNRRVCGEQDDKRCDQGTGNRCRKGDQDPRSLLRCRDLFTRCVPGPCPLQDQRSL